MSDAAGEVRAHTVRLELVDEPGELLRALEPVAENGGNLLSIFHERGNVTPRGHIPVEVDLEATPGMCPRGVTLPRSWKIERRFPPLSAIGWSARSNSPGSSTSSSRTVYARTPSCESLIDRSPPFEEWYRSLSKSTNRVL